MTAIQGKGGQVMVELTWEPTFGIMTSFAAGNSIYSELVSVNILMTLGTRRALVLERPFFLTDMARKTRGCGMSPYQREFSFLVLLQ